MNRVHHVSWCLEPENMDAAKEMWEQQLGVELIDFVLEVDGLRVLLAWDAGVELISPHGPPGPAGRWCGCTSTRTARACTRLFC